MKSSVLVKSMFGVCLIAKVMFGQSAEAVGTSSVTISGSEVIAFGSTQLDYTSALYYDLGTSVALWSGSSDSSLSLAGQDDELANRSLVTGTVTVSAATNTVYLVDTSHYIDLIYEVSGSYDDQYGFSLLPSEEDDSEMDLVAPNTQELISGDEIDCGDTYAEQATSASCPTDITVSSSTAMNLPYSSYLTGIGAIEAMVLSPSTTSFDGYMVSENVKVDTTVTQTCSAAIGNTCNGSSTFTVGNGGTYRNGTVLSGAHNTFYDQHWSLYAQSTLDVTGQTSCTTTCRQVYSCNGADVAVFRIVRTFTKDTLTGGTHITRVAITKTHQ